MATITTTQAARRTYSAEELRRLRNATSQPKLREAIEEHDGEDAELVKEHILRGSKSFAARSWRSRQSANSLRIPSDKENRSTNVSEATDRPVVSRPIVKLPGVLSEIAPNNQSIRGGPWRQRQSPTPSLRKKKIESLVKAHGSPQHVRVTAGGRIVPSEQSPLCHPRYGYSAVQINGGLVKFAPNHPVGKAQWSQATQNGFVAQDVNGRLCQIVDGTVLPLTEVDGALQLYMPAPNLNITQRGTSTGATNAAAAPSAAPQPRQSSVVVASDPPHAAQISALELEYSKLDAELKDLNKTEVLHGRTMGRAAKEALVTKRRELVVSLDNVRKSLKSLRDQAAPLDIPDASQHTGPSRSMSTTSSRLPGFLQQRQNMPHMPVQQAPPAMLGPFFGAMQPPPFPAPWGIQPTPSPESAYGQPWAMPPPAMFAQPPPFDGSLSAVGLPPQSEPAPAPERPVQHGTSAPQQATSGASDLPQNDGSCSVADLEKISPLRQSRAVPIKAPEPKSLKSNLNPMSPVYKPGQSVSPQSNNDPRPAMKSVEGRAPTPLALFHQLNPSLGGPLRVVNPTDEIASPPQKILVQSSSVASFETADFFPRNTREYSTRKHEYPDPDETAIENKENIDLQRHDSKRQRTITPEKLTIVHDDYDVASPHPTAPAAPPGTPVNADAVLSNTQLPVRIDGCTWERQSHGNEVDNVPDRERHNLSPKIKRREFLFVEERPDQLAAQPSPAPEKYIHLKDELCVQSSPHGSGDFLKKPHDFVEGYQAGLERQVPAIDRSGDYVEGYCAGLRKATSASRSSSTINVSAATNHSNGSPTKQTSRRPSPVGVAQRSDGRRNALMPIEAQDSMDTLKQAILAPHNENAVLTPAADGPHVTEAPLNLGAWTRQHGSGPLLDMPAAVPAGLLSGFHFPARTSSMVQRQGKASDELVGPKNEIVSAHGFEDSQGSTVPLLQKVRSGNEPNPLSRAASISKSIAASHEAANAGARVSSMTSIDSNLYRHWPGNRVFSPHLEYKSISSVAQHAGLASGFFAQVPGQFDGTQDTVAPLPPAAPKLTHAHPATGPALTQRPHGGVMSDNLNVAPRPYISHFKESSLDGMSNPPASPPMSPRSSPKKDSPTRGSPARAKFEHIAGKVGIKVSNNGKKKETSATGGEPVSPKGKGLWHKAWGLGRKDSTTGENTVAGGPAYK